MTSLEARLRLSTACHARATHRSGNSSNVAALTDKDGRDDLRFHRFRSRRQNRRFGLPSWWCGFDSRRALPLGAMTRWRTFGALPRLPSGRWQARYRADHTDADLSTPICIRRRQVENDGADRSDDSVDAVDGRSHSFLSRAADMG